MYSVFIAIFGAVIMNCCWYGGVPHQQHMYRSQLGLYLTSQLLYKKYKVVTTLYSACYKVVTTLYTSCYKV